MEAYPCFKDKRIMEYSPDGVSCWEERKHINLAKEGMVVKDAGRL